MLEKKNNKTKYDIIRVASELFLENGYSVTSPNTIAKKLNISTGNVTYYFPVKERLLLIIVEMLLDYCWEVFKNETDDGKESLSTVCLEFMTIAAACEQSLIIKDFFVSLCESELCRDSLRNNHVERTKRMLKDQCANWTDEQFQLAELMVIGIYYAMITTNDEVVPLATRIPKALYLILKIYHIDDEIIKAAIEKVLKIDYRKLGKEVEQGFLDYVRVTNEKTFETVINHRKN